MPPLQRDIHLAAAGIALACALLLTLLLGGGLRTFACTSAVLWIALHGIVQIALTRIRIHWRAPRPVPVPPLRAQVVRAGTPNPRPNGRRILRDDEPLLQ